MMVLHRLVCVRPLCNCGGYHYKHRPGSPYCILNERGDLRQAMRYVDTIDEQIQVLADWAWDSKSKSTVSDEPPF